MADPVVYLLQCADGSLYCGWTKDLARRVRQHERGVASRYTKTRLPVALAGSWPARDRAHALRTEAAIKRLPRSAKLDLVAGVASPP